MSDRLERAKEYLITIPTLVSVFDGDTLEDLQARAFAGFADAEFEYLTARLEKYEAAYNELINAVASKYPDETRHETALKYIRRAEDNKGSEIASTALQEGEGKA
jgi:hypothetical protein